MGLTDRQRELLVYLETRESPPTHRDMQKVMGVGPGGIDRLLNGLAERGKIIRRRGQHPCFLLMPPLPWAVTDRLLVLPNLDVLCVIHGPDHWERRFAELREAA